MGCCGSREEEEERSRLIDKQIRSERSEFHKTMDILMLGGGECGKTTIIKQMKLIYANGFTGEEKAEYLHLARLNALQSIVALSDACGHLGVAFENSQSEEAAERVGQFVKAHVDHEAIRSENYHTIETVPGAVVDSVQHLWNDEPAIQTCYKRASEFQLIDNADYFIGKFGQVSQTGYVVTNEDIIRARKQTTVHQEYLFKTSQGNIRITDVGGQRRHRKIWGKLFSDATNLLFIAALSDYNLQLAEQKGVNRLQDGMDLFKNCINNATFRNTNVVLFLNKTDVFMKKLETCPIETHFPQFHGGGGFDQGKMFVKDCFKAQNLSPGRTIYVHYTCATDTNALGFLLQTVFDTLVQQNLRQVGLT